MVRTDYRYGLNPVVVQAIANLHYKYSDETPKMWCSRIYVPFKKLLEYNPRFFSKNEYIHMTEREYKDGEFRPGERTSHIYCTVCDLLVFILNNTEKCANNHLNECIARIEQRHVVYVRSILLKRKIKKGLSSDEIGKLYNVYFAYKKSYKCTAYNTPEGQKFMERMAYRVLNSARAIQQAWWSYKLKPKTWAKQVWNMVRNDGSPDRKKHLGILSTSERKINPQTQEEYDLHTDEYVDCLKKAYNENIAQKYIKEYLAKRHRVQGISSENFSGG